MWVLFVHIWFELLFFKITRWNYFSWLVFSHFNPILTVISRLNNILSRISSVVGPALQLFLFNQIEKNRVLVSKSRGIFIKNRGNRFGTYIFRLRIHMLCPQQFSVWKCYRWSSAVQSKIEIRYTFSYFKYVPATNLLRVLECWNHQTTQQKERIESWAKVESEDWADVDNCQSLSIIYFEEGHALLRGTVMPRNLDISNDRQTDTLADRISDFKVEKYLQYQVITCRPV